MVRLVLVALSKQESVDELAAQIKLQDPQAAVYVTLPMGLDESMFIMNNFEVLTKDVPENG